MISWVIGFFGLVGILLLALLCYLMIAPSPYDNDFCTHFNASRKCNLCVSCLSCGPHKDCPRCHGSRCTTHPYTEVNS